MGTRGEKNAYAKSEGLQMVKEIMGEKDWRQQEIEKRERRLSSGQRPHEWTLPTNDPKAHAALYSLSILDNGLVLET
jgi:hypothetical protein